MERYGIIVTEKANRDDPIIHWLRRGTVVQVLSEDEVECVAPCYGVDFAKLTLRKHRQFLNPGDLIEIASDQIAALGGCLVLRPLKIASACIEAWPLPRVKSEALTTVRAIVRRNLARKLAEQLRKTDPDELWRLLHTIHPDKQDKQ